MKKLIAYILGLFILTSATAYAIGAAPLRVEFTSQPGETVQGQVSVFNDSDTEQIIVVGKGDFLVNGDEDVEFYDDIKEDNLYSLQEWIHIPNNEIELGPKSTGVIPYEIKVPIDAPSQGYYGSLFIQSKPKTAPRELFGATVSVRVAHLVLLTVEGELYEEINIEDFSVVQQNDEGLTEFDVVLFNKGNVHTAPAGQIEIIDNQGNLVQILDLNQGEYHVLPESKKTYKEKSEFEKLPAGKYYIALEGETDFGVPLEAQMTIEKTNDNQINILEKKIGKSNGKEIKKILTETRVVRNSLIVVIGIFLFAVAFAAATKFCFACTGILKERRKKRKKPKKRVAKAKKK
ncbi:hypothetical protein ACFL3T_01475 [Patescibacteria group bacterium]